MTRKLPLLLAASLVFALPSAFAQQPTPTSPAPSTSPTSPTYDSELAAQVGADDYGMRSYVLVILKTGPTPVPEGEARKAMFAGHFANMKRLAEEGKLALAGPFSEDPAGWRGLFVLAVDDIDAARELVGTDPVVTNGEMVAEYHNWYGSAATMLLPELHKQVARKNP